ncbi:hypothetical protein [Paraburkholderia sp.]|uniref:hypothetical protein n=1 Tax=Paraburkholderia sp. TaxID=1926495 RepID=UPI003D6FF41D
MLQSVLLARETALPRTQYKPRPQPAIVSFVTLDVTIPGTSSSQARHVLHSALGDGLRLYIVTVDKRHEYTTFRIEVTGRTLDEVITVLTRALGNATLGRAAASVIRRPATRTS